MSIDGSKRWYRMVAWAACLAFGSVCAEPPTEPPPRPSADLVRQQALLDDAAQRIGRGEFANAIDRDLDPLIAEFAKIDDGSQAVYAPRWPVESLFYMAGAVSGALPNRNGRAVALDALWGYAFYLKGYALVELRRLDDARPLLEHAVELAPQNAQFLSELAQWHAVQRDWPTSLALFRRSAEAAETFTPPAIKNKELSRAWRGIAYVDVELGRFDEAAAYYERCVALDPRDERAKRELGYVRTRQWQATP